eukprot:gene8969-16104_t
MWFAKAKYVEDGAPSHIVMPTGTRVLLDYSGEEPKASVRMQEAFGMLDSPRIAGGRIPVVMELLSPRGSPLQTTRDLAGFWATSYKLVLQDVKSQWKRHYWPEDPSIAEPTKLTKRGMERQEEREAAKAVDTPSHNSGGAAQSGKQGGKKIKKKR